MNTRSSKEYRYIFTTTWKQAPSISPHHWLTTRAAGRLRSRIFSFSLSLSYLIFSCYQLPFCEFPKHTTALHYRYDNQMYCTFVLFVNQHFPGLPESGTHCISERAYYLKGYVQWSRSGWWDVNYELADAEDSEYRQGGWGEWGPVKYEEHGKLPYASSKLYTKGKCSKQAKMK
jgi:hypothetical protein